MRLVPMTENKIVNVTIGIWYYCHNVTICFFLLILRKVAYPAFQLKPEEFMK